MTKRSQHRDILISGASVAGSTLAYWPSRHGFQPTVVERAPGVRKGGYAAANAITLKDYWADSPPVS